MRRLLGLAAAACLSLASSAGADVLILDDRSRLEGRIVEEGSGEVVIETYDQGPIAVAASRIRQRFERRSKLDPYDTRAEQTPDTADGRYELGRWCKSRGLAWRAMRAWEAAIALDPEHAKARQALGHEFHEGRWMTEAEVKEAKGYVLHEGRWIRREVAERLGAVGRIELDLVVAVKPNADRRWLEGCEARMREAAKSWWQCTEGWMAIRRVRIVDGTTEGDIVLHNLDSDRWWPGREYGRVEAGRFVYLGGQFLMLTFCHELGHLYFGLPEEYIDPKCGDCVMNPWTGVLKFCDGGNHSGRGGDCWTTILARHPQWKRRREFGEAPPVQITIEDR